MSELERCRPWLERSILDGSDFGVLEAALRAGQARLWPAENAAVVTAIGKHLQIVVAGGDLRGIVELLAPVEAEARAQACERIILGGRDGWARVLAPHGFKPLSLLVKEL